MSALRSKAGLSGSYPVHSPKLAGWWSFADQADPITDRSGKAIDLNVVSGAVANIQGYGAGRAQYEASALPCVYAVTTTTDYDLNDANTSYLFMCRMNIAVGTTGNGGILAKANNNGASGNIIKYATGRIIVQMLGANVLTSNEANLHNGTDFHIAIIVDRDTGTVSLYINGTLDKSVSGVPVETTDLSSYPLVFSGYGRTGSWVNGLENNGGIIQIWDNQFYFDTGGMPADIATSIARIAANEGTALTSAELP